MWWFYALLAAISAAFTTIFAKLGVKDTSADLATAIRTLVVLLMAWGIVLGRQSSTSHDLLALSKKTWIFLLLSGVMTGSSWIFYFKALQLGDAARVAPIDKSSLVFTIVLAGLLLGEALSWKIVAGCILIIFGTLIIIW